VKRGVIDFHIAVSWDV